MFHVAIWPENSKDENEFDYVLSNHQPDSIYVMGGFQCTNNILRDAPTADTFADLPVGDVVLLAPQSSRFFSPIISLLEFQHPSEAVYIFGPNNQHIDDSVFGGRNPDHVVFIPTDTDDEMFAHVAYIITAWHRRYG